MKRSGGWMNGKRAAVWVMGLALVAGCGEPGRAAQPKRPAAPPAAAIGTTGQAPTDEQLGDLREQLLGLLRMSPVMTEAVAADPTLLADDAYVQRSNPQLAQFLAAHPDISRSPEFYLFGDLPGRGRREQRLERRLWTGPGPTAMEPGEERRRSLEVIMPGFAMVVLLGALLWLVRVVLQNRRWSKMFQLQTETHARILERFGTSAELMEYMQTEAGRRFLEAAPIPLEPEGQQLPGALSRVVGSVQAGLVLTMLGIGLMYSARSSEIFHTELRVLGLVTLMPGIGLLISAAITWLLMQRLGLTPPPAHGAGESHS